MKGNFHRDLVYQPDFEPFSDLHHSGSDELVWWEKAGDALPEYSNKQINNAGILIRDADLWDDELNQAYDIVGAWRSSHVYPLRAAYMVLQRRAKRIDSLAVACQRLKRVRAIREKLRRPESHDMKLSTMQDIGGCRAVLNDIGEVRQLASLYANIARDYVKHPKADGYRSIHLVERYQPRLEKHERYTGCRIEIQIRSRLQHAWATAVETVDFVLGQKLKLGAGDPDWKRFFMLAASAIALHEDSPLVPNTPTDKNQLVRELRDISAKLNAFRLLGGLHLVAYSAKRAQKQLRAAGRKAAAYLLLLDMQDPQETRTRLTVYAPEQLAKANQNYINLEKEIFGNPKQQAVLLFVSKFADLKPAYPNYHLDAHKFVWTIEEFIRST